MKRLLTFFTVLILFGLTASEAISRAIYVGGSRGYGYGRSYYGGGYGYRSAYYGGGYGYRPYYGYGYPAYPYYGGYYAPYYYPANTVVVGRPYYYGYPPGVFVGGPGFGIGINTGY